MLVTLDGQRLAGDFSAEATLAALVGDVRTRFLGERLLVGVAVNGVALTDTTLETRLSATVSRDDQIDLESGERCEVVQAALRDAAREIGEAAEDHRALADAINGGRTVEAFESLRELVAVWQGCQRAVVEGGALLGRDLTACEYAGRVVREFIRELAEKLRALRDVLDARDTVSLADLAYYELPPLCETWQGLLQALAADAGHNVD